MSETSETETGEAALACEFDTNPGTCGWNGLDVDHLVIGNLFFGPMCCEHRIITRDLLGDSRF